MVLCHNVVTECYGTNECIIGDKEEYIGMPLSYLLKGSALGSRCEVNMSSKSYNAYGFVFELKPAEMFWTLHKHKSCMCNVHLHV